MSSSKDSKEAKVFAKTDKKTETAKDDPNANYVKKNNKYSDQKRWHVVYPAYINAKHKITQGRKLARQYCVERPSISEIEDICRYLKLPCEVEPKKAYPRDATEVGRVRVQIRNDDKTPLRSDIPSIRSFLKFAGTNIGRLKSRLSGESTTSKTTDATSEITTEPVSESKRKAKKRQGKKKA
eukprot:TRINITY_DN1004_c3_g1_i1.p1 TRINITY_DN1004_c3_g1~~TRINITY_DN1004_c3_g1_i1.p1  ORF type:complete len:182 (+),score=30.32 TRINITY_DN1004_c3_g1_i1:94-639(+)